MRRLALAVSLLALLPAAAASAAAPVSPQAAHRALENAREALSGQQTFAAGPGAAGREATIALRDLAVALPALRGADRVQARGLLARPTSRRDRFYMGREAPASPKCNASYCIHWSNAARTRPTDDFRREVGKAIARSREVENGDLRWTDPKPDGRLGSRHGRGARGQFDVYVTDLAASLYGYASVDPGQRGRHRYAYLVLDNDYVGFPTGPVKSMQVTAAHEYNHVLQFKYDTYEDTWMFEGTATWAEDKVYPEINDYLNYLPGMAQNPQAPITYFSPRDTIVYSRAVWNHWLSATVGDRAVRDAWRISPSQRSFAVASYGKAIERRGGSGFARTLADFFAATAEWRALPSFPDSALYPDMRRSGVLGTAMRRTRLDDTSYRLYDVAIPGTDPVRLDVEAEPGTRSSISLVGREGGARSGTVTTATTYLKRGGDGSVSLPNPGTYSRITAIVANVDGRSKRRDRSGERVYSSDGSSYRFGLG